MKKLALFSGAVLSLAAAACGNDTPAENEVERQAEAIDEAYEADADLQEAFAEGAPNEQQLKEGAEQLRETGEAIKDDLKEAADEMGRDTREMREAGSGN